MGRAVARDAAVTAPKLIAEALALAFLAGPWNQAELTQRAKDVLGERPRWLARLVRFLLGRFSAAPNDAYTALRETIQRAPAFKRGHAAGQPRSRLVKLVVGDPTMGTQRWSVPTLCTSADVASWLELTPSELDWFADVRSLNRHVSDESLQHYTFRWLAKRRGGYRLLEAPKQRLKKLQQRVLREILERVPVHFAAHGFVKGRSVLSCVQPHAERAALLRMDLV